MKIDGRLIIVLTMVLALIPGAYGGSVSVGRGSSVAVSEGSSAEGILASDGSVTQSSVSSNGVIDNLNIDPWVQNTNGDYAEIGVTGTNVAGFTYRDNYYPGKGSGWVSNAVWAQQWMSASSADSLHAYARASNLAGDKAEANLDLKYGSLNGYYSAAYTGPAPWLGMNRVASAQQTLDSATGSEISAQTLAVDPVGDAAGSLTSVKQGSLYGYSVFADAARYSNGLRAAGVSVDSMSASAPYGSIDQTMCAIDYWGDTSLVSIDINKGNLYSYPYYSDVPSIAYSISDWRQTYASQSYDAEAIGYGSFVDRYRYANQVAIPPTSTYYERMYNRNYNWDNAWTSS